jgi:hypothetical protein
MGTTKSTNAPLRQLVTELRQALAEAERRPGEGYQEAVGLLHGFAGQVAEFLNGEGRAPAEVVVELGHVVEQGQEHQVVVRAPAIGLQDYLLRAYVPFDGFPVTLDTFGDEDRQASSPEALVRELVALMRRDDMVKRLLVHRQALGDPSLGVRTGVKKMSKGGGAGKAARAGAAANRAGGAAFAKAAKGGASPAGARRAGMKAAGKAAPKVAGKKMPSADPGAVPR